MRSQASGVIFNNQMDNFNTPGKFRFEVEPKANFIVPQKRPLSTAVPTIILNKDGSIKMVIGASGGIIMGVGTGVATGARAPPVFELTFHTCSSE